MPVEVPTVVPLIMTVTPGMGAPSSPFTVPLMLLDCALAITPAIMATTVTSIAFSEKDVVIMNDLC